MSDELQRNFKFIGIVGFVTILQATWESSLLANYYGLLNGGTGGVIWCTIAVWLCIMCMIASLYVFVLETEQVLMDDRAEMASMAPTA